MSATKAAPNAQTKSQAPGPQDSGPGADEFPPQRSSRWIDLIVIALVMIVLLGGIGNAFSEAGVLEPPITLPAADVEGCPEGGCVRPPDELCGGKPFKAIVGADGQRLYYSAEHPSYFEILAIHVERGDRWFCTAAAAETSGFAPAQ